MAQRDHLEVRPVSRSHVVAARGDPVDVRPSCRFGTEVISYNHMVVVTDEQNRVDQVFHALADRTRRDIVRRTLQGEHSVTSLAVLYPMSFAAIQKHVAVLERAELVSKRRHGREQLVRANVETVRRAFDLLGQYEALWRDRVDRMDQLLNRDHRTGDTP